MVIIGTSGFFYKDWKGVFYPEGLPLSSFLDFYSKHLNGLEINASFYRLPTKSSIKAYTKYNLQLVFKLHKSITHSLKLTDETVSPFLTAKELLQEKLNCFLAQFPKTFKPSEKNKEFILKIKSTFKDTEVAFEFRNKEWEKEKEFFTENSICVVFADFPENLQWLRGGIATKKLAYFRFHGRERLYNYLYSKEELKNLAEKVKETGSITKYCFFNNTTKGKAALNALEFKNFFRL